MSRIGGEDASKIAIVDLRIVDCMVRLFLFIVLGERLRQLAQRLDPQAARDERLLSGDLSHQLVDILQFLQRGPSGIAPAPVRAGRQPHRKGLGKILIRVALRVPQRQMIDVATTGWIWPIISWVAPRRWAEQLPPAAPAVQLIGHLHYMAGFVAQNAHTIRHRSPFDVDHPFALEPHQAGMGEVEGNRDAGRVVGAEPLVRDPGVRPDPQPPLGELVMEMVQAPLEPRSGDADLEILEAELEQLTVRQCGPGEPTRHGTTNPETTSLWHPLRRLSEPIPSMRAR